MRSLAALALLPVLTEAAGSQTFKRQQQCRSDSCFRAVGAKQYSNRGQDCQNFLGSTTVTADPSLLTAFVTADVTALLDIDATRTVVVPATALTTQQVTNTLTSYVATVTSTVLKAWTTDVADASVPVDTSAPDASLDKRQWDWFSKAKMPGGYPMYAAACWDAARYVSACNCAGINVQTVTVPGEVLTTTFTVFTTGTFETRVNTVDELTVTDVAATNVATQTVNTVVQATQTVVVTVTEGGNTQTTETPSSLGDTATPSVSSAVSSTAFSSDAPIPTLPPFSNSTLPPINQETETVVATVTATDDVSLTATPTGFQNNTQVGTLTSVITGKSSNFPSFTITQTSGAPTDTASLSDLGTRTSQSLSSAVASDFPTSILTANGTFATSTMTSTATPTPTGIAKSFRLKVQSGPLINSYLALQPWRDLGDANGGQAYLITFAGGNNGSAAAPSLWAMGGGLDMPGTSNSSIYAVDATARGKVIVATVGMNSRLAVAAPGPGAAYLASDLLQCAIDTNNQVSCQEAGVDGAPYNQLGNCGQDMGIFKGSNTCGGGSLFALTAEYV